MARIKYFNVTIEPEMHPHAPKGYLLKVKIETDQNMYNRDRFIYQDDMYTMFDKFWAITKRELDDYIKENEPLDLKQVERILEESGKATSQ